MYSNIYPGQIFHCSVNEYMQMPTQSMYGAMQGLMGMAGNVGVSNIAYYPGQHYANYVGMAQWQQSPNIAPYHDQGNATNHTVDRCSREYCGEEPIVTPKKVVMNNPVRRPTSMEILTEAAATRSSVTKETIFRELPKEEILVAVDLSKF
jgi:hypothetical protein